jgi:hypothetical protein
MDFGFVPISADIAATRIHQVETRLTGIIEIDGRCNFEGSPVIDLSRNRSLFLVPNCKAKKSSPTLHLL